MRQSIPCSLVLALTLAMSTVGCGGRAEKNESAAPGGSTPTLGDLGGDVETDPSSHGTIASYGLDGIVFFSPDSIGSTPYLTLEGSWQTDACLALAFDATSNLYALCYQADPSQPLGEVNVFAPTALGSASPTRVISGPDTSIVGYATDIAVDKAGNIYVVQDDYCQLPSGCSGMISVFAPGANGNATPTRVIQGPDTGLFYSAAIAVDEAGLIYVGNAEGGSLLVFAADASGDAQPIRRIGGDDIGDVTRIALDTSGMIYVTDVSRPGLLVYGPSSAEGDPPERVITGPKTGLAVPFGVALDGAGRLLVSDNHGLSVAPTISIFARDAAGDVAPEAQLSDVSGLGIAVAP